MSNFCAYSFGTGEVTGMIRNAANATALRLRELERDRVGIARVDLDARDVLQRARLLRISLEEVVVVRVLARHVLRGRALEPRT